MSAHCPVSGHDRAIYDARCSSGVTIGTRACTATMTLPRVSASSRLESWASRSCNPRQNSMRRPPMAASRSSPSSRRARGKSCRSPGGSQPSSLPAHRRLAKVHEHCSGTTIRARFLPSEAGPLLAAPASSWRTTCHSITSSARATAKRRCWIHPPVISCTSRLTGKPAWARTL